MTTLREHRVNLGWSQTELAMRAGTSQSVVRRAEVGETITARIAKAIADALSKAYGQEIKPVDIEGLNIL